MVLKVLILTDFMDKMPKEPNKQYMLKEPVYFLE